MLCDFPAELVYTHVISQVKTSKPKGLVSNNAIIELETRNSKISKRRIVHRKNEREENQVDTIIFTSLTTFSKGLQGI